MSPMDGRNSRCSRFSAGNSSVAVSIPLLPIATRGLSGLRLRLRLRQLLRLRLLLGLRLLACWLGFLAYRTRENHANGATAKQGSFKRRFFTAIYSQPVFELDFNCCVCKPALIQCGCPFRKVFAALLMTIHTRRGKRQIKEIV